MPECFGCHEGTTAQGPNLIGVRKQNIWRAAAGAPGGGVFLQFAVVACEKDARARTKGRRVDVLAGLDVELAGRGGVLAVGEQAASGGGNVQRLQ